MNYYSHHIGDFNNATRHLTRVERSLYRDAIELYYDTESALTKDFEKLSRRLLANTTEEKAALRDVLNEFFTETDDGFIHDRCDKEINKYRANTSNKAKAGIASAEARKQKRTGVEHVLNECETDVQLTNNHKPITNNQEPLKTKPTHKDKSLALPDWLSKEVWSEFKSMRTKIRKPLTQEAERLLFIDLEVIKKNGHDPIAAINNSIKNSWQGIFEPKQNLHDAKQKQSRMDISGVDYKAGVNADGSF